MLKWLSYGPRKDAVSYTGYIINSQRFHTTEIERSTQNSGVSIEATTMCRSSAKDVSQVADVISYYGVLKQIILLDYHIVQIPVFKCDWANVRNGIRVEDGFTLVNLHQSQNPFVRDPFILASQAKQVFYSREHDSSNWYVVLRAPPRGFYELEKYDEIDYMSTIFQQVEERNDTYFEDTSEDYPYMREDCEGILV